MTALINTEMHQCFANKDSKMEEKKKKKPKKKKFTIDIKNMGVNIDKNEYREIVLSNSNHPEIFKR